MSSNDATPEQIQADIERQREELARTVDQLHARLDVKTRAQEKLADLRERTTTASGRPRPDLTTAAVATLVIVVGLVLWRRRH